MKLQAKKMHFQINLLNVTVKTIEQGANEMNASGLGCNADDALPRAEGSVLQNSRHLLFCRPR